MYVSIKSHQTKDMCAIVYTISQLSYNFEKFLKGSTHIVHTDVSD